MAAPVTVWVTSLISTLIIPSPHHCFRCGFKPRTGHMWDKPSSASACQVVSPGVLTFRRSIHPLGLANCDSYNGSPLDRMGNVADFNAHNSVTPPLWPVWVQTSHWSHVGQAKFCLRVPGGFSRGTIFSPHIPIG